MSEVHPKTPRLSVRDSFDDDDPSDVDDEVFIRDGKHGILKIDDDCGLKRPLMASRKKPKVTHFSDTSQVPIKTVLAPFCYTVIGFGIIIGLIILCAITIIKYPTPLNDIKNWLTPKLKKPIESLHIVPCTSLESEIVWTRSFPKFLAEAPLKSTDVNGDGINDLIVGFGTGTSCL